MIVTADSQVALQTNRRRTGNGWNTSYIGKNRSTLREGEAAPAPDIVYPVAFLVEKDAAAIVKPHFHSADQYQVVVQGGGRLGPHNVDSVSVHYTDAYSAYGPIIASGEGISWFTLRNAWDSGARYMPAQRQVLRDARARFQHRESTCGPLTALSEAELAALTDVTGNAVIEETKDGLGTWRYTVNPGGIALGPHPSTGGGQFWLVTSGLARVPGGALLPPNSTVFVGPDDAALAMTAGPSGADLLCMQFPKHARD
ncbi:MAG: hypothetical protein EXR07_10655 [Acetobacteraceae bacterium]|nr:hypothetical protein [Acetobacteraceae bacterium]